MLRECNRISFYQRSLPLAGVMGTLTYYGVKAGHLSGNPRFGAAPKICVAVAIGYFVGKISFQSKCAEMLMTLPNSKLAEVLRQKKKGNFYGQLAPDQGFGSGLALQPFSSYADGYSDEHVKKKQGSALDIDETRPTFSGLDDVYRQNLDSPPVANYDDLAPIETKPGVSYDELRKKNREEFYKKQQGTPPPNVNEPLYRPPVVRAPQPPPPSSDGDTGSVPLRKNKYGDVWTDTR